MSVTKQKVNEPISGLLVIDKEPGWTSHDVVAKVRKIFGQKKVGHSGTLDPSATGVLLVGLGSMTRLLSYLGDLEKSYSAEIVFGATTTTLDADGEITQVFDMSALGLREVQKFAATLVGDIKQIPPMVSAVKIGGKRLHALFREGIEIERPPRPVHVSEFNLQATKTPKVYKAHVLCSSGTYIRVLADDLGRGLGGGAHVRNLRRTGIGSFCESTAVKLDSIAKTMVISPAQALGHLGALVASGDEVRAASQGRPINNQSCDLLNNDVIRILDDKGTLLALYKTDDHQLRAVVVLPSS